MSQSFFDNLEYNLIEPLVSKLHLLFQKQYSFDFDVSLFTLAANISDITLTNGLLTQTDRMFSINDDSVYLDIHELSMDFDINYEFI